MADQVKVTPLAEIAAAPGIRPFSYPGGNE
jgi:hypothetical protein